MIFSIETFLSLVYSDLFLSAWIYIPINPTGFYINIGLRSLCLYIFVWEYISLSGPGFQGRSLEKTSDRILKTIGSSRILKAIGSSRILQTIGSYRILKTILLGFYRQSDSLGFYRQSDPVGSNRQSDPLGYY